MQNISCEQALEIIKDMGVSAVIEYDSLSNLMGGNDHVECYENGELLVVIDYCEEDGCEYVSLIPYWQSFEIGGLKALMSEHCVNPVLLVNSQKLSEEFEQRLADEILELAGPETKVFSDYVHMDMNVPDGFSDGVRMLVESDKDLCLKTFVEEMKYRPPFSLLFDLFVSKKVGYILGAFDGSQPVGYLAFNEISSDVFDVDFVYVLPERRSESWGKKLASSYACFADKQRHVAYWSNAKNEASVRTATASGFELVRMVKKFNKN